MIAAAQRPMRTCIAIVALLAFSALGARAQRLTALCPAPIVPLSIFMADASAFPSGLDAENTRRMFRDVGIVVDWDTWNPVDRLTIMDERHDYQGWASQTDPITRALGFHNVILQVGANPVSFTMRFDHPVRAVAFRRSASLAGPNGLTLPPWLATAYDPSGHVTATASEDEIRSWEAIGGRSFLLSGSQRIATITFYADDHKFDGQAGVVISDLAWCP